MALASCTLPTVAAVNGPAVGAGLNLALAADVRIAGPTAVFDPRFQKLGIHPGGGATWMLQRAVGPQVARAALLFGMRFDAETAVTHGLALHVADDPVAAALDLARGPASAPREVVLATKATMRATASPGTVDTDTHHSAMRTELGPQASSIQSRNLQHDWPRLSAGDLNTLADSNFHNPQSPRQSGRLCHSSRSIKCAGTV